MIVASDTPVYWNYTSFIKENAKRYSVAFFNNDMQELIYSEYKIPFERQFLIPYSTDLHSNKTIASKYDISFIGNFYNLSLFLTNFLFHKIGDLTILQAEELKN